MRNKKVILIHGYFKNSKDMKDLEKYLIELGYDAISVDLPLTFNEIDIALYKFENIFKNIVDSFEKGDRVSLVGHSTGGLIIRRFILDNPEYIDLIDRCILISTPNRGSEVADIVTRYLRISTSIFSTIKSLKTTEVENINSIDKKHIKIGAIAGDKDNLILGRVLSNKNDGRVRIESVKYDNLDDFIILPYNHAEIHHKKATAKLVDKFIREGKFK